MEVLEAVAVESIFSVRVLRITSGVQRSMYVLPGNSRLKRKVLTTIEEGTSISDIHDYDRSTVKDYTRI